MTPEAEAVIAAWRDAGLLTDDDPRLAYTRLVRAQQLADLAAQAVRDAVR